MYISKLPKEFYQVQHFSGYKQIYRKRIRKVVTSWKSLQTFPDAALSDIERGFAEDDDLAHRDAQTCAAPTRRKSNGNRNHKRKLDQSLEVESKSKSARNEDSGITVTEPYLEESSLPTLELPANFAVQPGSSVIPGEDQRISSELFGVFALLTDLLQQTRQQTQT